LTLSEFIDRVEQGGGVQIYLSNAGDKGGEYIFIREHHYLIKNDTFLELGLYYTASDVLGSYDLRRAIDNGTIIAVTSSQSISKNPNI